MAETFQFETENTPIPILAARWQGDDPYSAEVFFQNTCFTMIYGNMMHTRLVDLFDKLLHNNLLLETGSGKDLMARLLAESSLASVRGVLSGRRTSLYARVQENEPNTIQVIAIDTTSHYFDNLTGIAGRELFFDRLKMELMRAVREKTEVHVCYLDLDGFKPVNDLNGHSFGDRVLREVASRLQSLIRRHETVARLGGDEFIVLLSGSDIDPVRFAEKRIIPAINAPYTSDGLCIDTLGVSIGIASFPQWAAKAEELVTHADDAMYLSKARGKNQVCVFVRGMENAKKR